MDDLSIDLDIAVVLGSVHDVGSVVLRKRATCRTYISPTCLYSTSVTTGLTPHGTDVN